MYVYLSQKKHRKNKLETNKISYIKDEDGTAVEGKGFDTAWHSMTLLESKLLFILFHFCHVQNNFKLYFYFSWPVGYIEMCYLFDFKIMEDFP